MTDPTPLDPEPTGYSAAVDELEAILAEIEGRTVDVDVLAERVARAAGLIEWCRTRLTAAQTAIDDVTANIDPG